MSIQKITGNNHVKCVKKALHSLLRRVKSIEAPTALETAKFILNKYPDIDKVLSKFEFPNPDLHYDLTLHLKSGNVINVNLFVVKGDGGIQPKNVGAQSFISKYFLDDSLQNEFNKLYDKEYNQYLTELFEYKTGYPITSISREEMRKIMPLSTFNQDINEFRDRLLYSLREHCFNLFQKFCNDNPTLIENGFNTMLMVNDFNIITRTYQDGRILVEEFNPNVGVSFRDIKLFKTGIKTVSILCGSACLNLRFKLEWGPYTSVKLAISHKHISNPNTYDQKNKKLNFKTLQTAKGILHHTNFVKKKNNSNAIGKCNEALVYLHLLEKFPDTVQVDSGYCLEMLKSYAPELSLEEINKLNSSSILAADEINKFLNSNYPKFTLENIELVPESYVSDKLDTADLKLNIRYNKKRITEKLSLKAINKDRKLTVKNPGIGTILGENFFNLAKENEELHRIVEILKEKFNNLEYTHSKCLEIASKHFGEFLQRATQEQLYKGIENILGKPIVIVTVYDEAKAYIHKRDTVSGEIIVYAQTPTNIQTTLAWDNQKYKLSLRVKFSRGHEHGWSSLKFAAEQKIK